MHMSLRYFVLHGIRGDPLTAPKYFLKYCAPASRDKEGKVNPSFKEPLLAKLGFFHQNSQDLTLRKGVVGSTIPPS
jgi:hypothetical protein